MTRQNRGLAGVASLIAGHLRKGRAKSSRERGHRPHSELPSLQLRSSSAGFSNSASFWADKIVPAINIVNFLSSVGQLWKPEMHSTTSTSQNPTAA